MNDAVRPPRVSVLMPVHNAARTLGAAISGVLTQTYPNVELIVVNDGSTDESLAVAEAYGDQVHVITTPNRGVAHARNVAAAAATGEFLAFCDSDDFLLPPSLQLSLELLQRSPSKTIITNEAMILAASGLAHGRKLLRNTVPAPDRQRLAILERNFVGIFAVFPRSLFDEVGGFDPKLRQLEDWELWMRAIYAGWRVRLQPTPAAAYRMTANSLSTMSDRFDMERRMLSALVDSDKVRLAEAERDYLSLRLSSPAPMELRQMGTDALRRGEWADARRVYRQLAPLSRDNPMVRVRSELIGRVPGSVYAFGLRQRLIDRRLTGRAPDDTDDTAGLEEWRT